MNYRLLLFCWAVFSVAPFAHAGNNQAGEFDYYVLALSWHPAFCEINRQRKECEAINTGRAEPSLVIHGLWPNRHQDKRHQYGYCDVALSLKTRDKQRKWCELPALNLPSLSSLQEVMPGVFSCLQRHEWYKHGSCSGLTAEQYFIVSEMLLKKTRDSVFGQFIRSSAGTTVKRSNLLKQFEASFGDGSGRFLQMLCKNIRGRHYLYEIRLTLNRKLEDKLPLNALFYQKAKIKRGSCGDQVSIDGAGLN